MSTMERIYDDAQREAITSAYLDRGIRPQRRILEMAEAGELTLRGEAIPAFKMPISTFRYLLVQERKRRAGRVRGETAKLSHEDAIEALRVRLVNLADTTLAAEEKVKADKRDPERSRQIARLVREVASMPAKGAGRAIQPGQRGKDGEHESGRTTAMGGSLLAAARRRPATERPEHPDTQAENAESSADAEAQTQGEDSRQDAVPGSLGRSAVAV